MKKLLILIPCLLLLLWPGQAQVTHGVTLTWTAGANDVSYSVYRSTTSGGPYTQLTTGLMITTYKDTTGVAGTKYYYVVAGDAPGFLESAYSNESSATFLSQAAPPTGLGAVAN